MDLLRQRSSHGFRPDISFIPIDSVHNRTEYDCEGALSRAHGHGHLLHLHGCRSGNSALGSALQDPGTAGILSGTPLSWI